VTVATGNATVIYSGTIAAVYFSRIGDVVVRALDFPSK